MTHRDQIESAIREWGGRDRAELPKYRPHASKVARSGRRSSKVPINL
jgi:hypothetical protein